MTELTCIIAFFILSLLFAIASIVASIVCGYKNETNSKSEIYECGMKLFSDSKLQFDVKYFNFAVLFLIFDVETIFLFPFAVSFNKFDIFILFEIFLFVLILLFALIYAIRKNLLEVNK